MVRKKELRSEETKKMILNAARKLFSKKGYDAVTMREIAKEAGCSHTTIYLYFKDKEQLLYQLSMPTLHALHQQLQQIASINMLPAEDKLKKVSREYILFGLNNRNMYDIFINAKSSRVDEDEPELEINKLRVKMFGVLMQVIQECLSIEKNDQLLAFTRIFFYNLNGILGTYSYLHETIDELMERLTPTFDLAVDIFLVGCKGKIKQGEEE
jgi:AcrR family transcriptional regulator